MPKRQSIEPQNPHVFAYDNPLGYLKACLLYYKARRISFRSLSKSLGLKSPNYLQQVASGQRRLSVNLANRLSRLLDLSAHEHDYFLAMIELEKTKDTECKLEILERMRRILIVSNRRRVIDPDIHSSWVHGLVFELARTPKGGTEKEMCRTLSGMVSPTKVRQSLEFLLRKRYLVELEQGGFRQNNVMFEKFDDVRRIDLQRSHLQYLDLAKQRIHDDLQDREFQGVTVAISSKQFGYVKQQLRNFIVQLNDDLSAEEEPDMVIRIQTAAFRLNR